MTPLLIGVFLFSFFLFTLIFLKIFARHEKKIERRVRHYILQDDKEVLEPKKFQTTVNFRLTREKIKKDLIKKNKNGRIEMLLDQAGIPLKPEEFIMFQWIAIALGAGILFLIAGTPFVAPFGALIGYLIPKFVVKRKMLQRLKKFNDSLPEMISTIIGALRAGFSFPQALQTVMEESFSPTKEEIGLVLKEMQYGATVEEALNSLKERMPSEDLDIMIQAIIIQRQVGGNLATVLETIVQTIRSRIKIQGQISTLTAQGKMSGMVVGLLPIILGMVLFAIQPSYIGVLFTNTIGIILIVIAVISCTIGFIFIRKVTSIEV